MKWRFFRHLRFGDDPEAIKAYEWHIWHRVGARMRAGLPTDVNKRTLTDYVTTAQNLYESMSTNGFLAYEAIPLDEDGELLGGAHRLACALALDLQVSVLPYDRKVWAPPWGRGWFVEHGYPDMDRLDSDWELMQA